STTLQRHLVAVQTGHHRRGFAWYVDQDRGDGTPVSDPVVDPREHDDGRSGINREGERKQKRNRGRRTNAGQDADDLPDEHPEAAIQNVLEGEGDGEPSIEIVNEIHSCRLPTTLPGRSGAGCPASDRTENGCSPLSRSLQPRT